MFVVSFLKCRFKFEPVRNGSYNQLIDNRVKISRNLFLDVWTRPNSIGMPFAFEKFGLDQCSLLEIVGGQQRAFFHVIPWQGRQGFAVSLVLLVLEVLGQLLKQFFENEVVEVLRYVIEE